MNEGPLLVSVREGAKVAGIGRDQMYRLVAEGKVRSVAVGRRRLIPQHELHDWIARELAVADAGEVDTTDGDAEHDSPACHQRIG